MMESEKVQIVKRIVSGIESCAFLVFLYKVLKRIF